MRYVVEAMIHDESFRDIYRGTPPDAEPAYSSALHPLPETDSPFQAAHASPDIHQPYIRTRKKNR